ncbi:MAG: hypothetical protein IPH65_04410 [Dehalococcoidia bacterium]|uniref:hypothetical protein n=1 Tax=Candidatus Amarobacter glycogenicus TaxID=3140699 RepID=UPI0031372074|nr:hypothetical protein [Dehalococcoidia bacterium]
MSTMGRVIGHGMGVLFVALGAGFLVLGLSDAFTAWLDETSACQYGDCSGATAGARTTFVTMGVAFIGAGLISSAATEFAIRKTRSLVSSIGSGAGPGDAADSIAGFLRPFGIEVDPANSPNVTVQHRVIDLRGQRQGRDVPTDPAGLSAYLKSMGISIDEEVLRNATLMKGEDAVERTNPSMTAAGVASTASPPAPAPEPGPDLVLERASIVRKRDRGATAANQRLLELEVEVQPVGGVPYRVTIPTLVRSSLVSLLIEGSSLNVRVDPNDRNSVTIDWAEN